MSTGFENVMVVGAEGVRSDNGDKLLSISRANGLKVGGSLVKH